MKGIEAGGTTSEYGFGMDDAQEGEFRGAIPNRSAPILPSVFRR